MSFRNKRYVTKGIRDKVPLLIQFFLWQCIDELNEPRDKLQIFKCSIDDSGLKIIHIQEEPEYKREYQFTTDTPIFGAFRRGNKPPVLPGENKKL